MAHVCGHADFFKNNLWFAKTNRKMMDQMANHGTRMRRYAERYGHENVETFIDACLSIDNLIDIHSPFVKRRRERRDEDDDSKPVPHKLRSKEYMDRYINPPEFMEEQQRRLEEEIERTKDFPEQPERDVLLFLLEHARLERWQRDILGMIREEAYYFVPQAMTKIMNEGWACLRGDSLVFTEAGLIPMRNLVAGQARVVCDGETQRGVYDQHIIRDHETVKLTTRRGLVLEGSNNHRVLLADGETWRRLDELEKGDRIAVSGGQDLWAKEPVDLCWTAERRKTLHDVADAAGVSVWTVIRHRNGRSVRRAGEVATALLDYEPETQTGIRSRKAVRIPTQVDADLGAFLGYLVGDGHISRVKRHLGLTTGDEAQLERFEALTERLFEVPVRRKLDGNRWRAFVHAEDLADFLTEGLGLTSGPSAANKRIPDVVLRSPEPVVRAFLRAYFDCDGYAGRQGVILSTKSAALSEQSQLLLLNYGILSRRRLQHDGCWHLHVTGASAKVFAERVGFGLARKQAALEAYLAERQWFKAERWEDEVVALEAGRADVYDISVEETHRYVAQGVINHNSYWHSTLMTEKILDDTEVIDYADRHAGTMSSGKGQLNPYKVGIELFRHIEERWDAGKFGPEWEQCDDQIARRTWDKKLGLGREKIFEVRKIYNDVLFVDEFLTEEFAAEQKLFTFEYSKQSGDYVIASREFKEIKSKLLDQLTNWGNPFIYVTNGNHENRGELYMKHEHHGQDLRLDHAKDTLENVQKIWGRPVHLESVWEKRPKVMSYNGRKHSERTL
jgi:stage V sporulation protein R